MNCRRIQKILWLYPEGSLSKRQRAAVEAHLEQCPTCRRRVEDWPTLREALATPTQLPLSPDFDERVLQAAQARGLGPSSRQQRRRGTSLVLGWIPAIVAPLAQGGTSTRNQVRTFGRNLRGAFSPEENPFLAQERWGYGHQRWIPTRGVFRLAILLFLAPLALFAGLWLASQAQVGLWLASLVSLVHIPLILLTVGLHCGRAFSREEQQGTLDLLLMVPTRRPWLVWYKLAGPLRTGLRMAAYGLPLYLFSLLLGGVSPGTLLMLVVVCFLAAFPVAGPWTFTLLVPGERSETTSRRMPNLTETFWLTCFVLLGVFILGCGVVGGLNLTQSLYTPGEPGIASASESFYAKYLPLTVFVGLADALGRSHPFFHSRLWLLPPVLLLVVGMMLNRVLAAAARMHVAAAGEGRLRQWRTLLSGGITAGWLLLLLGYAWLPIEKGAIAYLSSPLPSLARRVKEFVVVTPEQVHLVRMNERGLKGTLDADLAPLLQWLPESSTARVTLEQGFTEEINAHELRSILQNLLANRALGIQLQQRLLDVVNAREIRRHAMTGLLLILFSLTAVVGSLWLIVSGPWREHLETLYRQGAGGRILFRELAQRTGMILAAPGGIFALVCLGGGFPPGQIPLANWAPYGLLTAVALLLGGAFGLWWTLAEAQDPSGRLESRCLILFVVVVLLWPVPAMLSRSPMMHQTALASPVVSFALQFHPANEGLQSWYGRRVPPPPQPGKVPADFSIASEESATPPVAPWWMALVLQGALAGGFLRAGWQLAQRAPGRRAVPEAEKVGRSGWIQRKWEWLQDRFPRWLDNPIALKEWRLMARQADMIVIGLLILGTGLALAYVALRWPDQLPPVWAGFVRVPQSFPWSSAFLLYLLFTGGLLFLLGPVALGDALAKERDKGTWPFVLITPLSDGAIMRGKWLGLMAPAGMLMGVALPLLLLFAGASSLELMKGRENLWAPWLLVGIGGTWFCSLALAGSAAGLYAACRFPRASRAQLAALFWTFCISLGRLGTLPFLAGDPGLWLIWHGLGLGIEIGGAVAFYQAACHHCHQARAGDIQSGEEEARLGAEEG